MAIASGLFLVAVLAASDGACPPALDPNQAAIAAVSQALAQAQALGGKPYRSDLHWVESTLAELHETDAWKSLSSGDRAAFDRVYGSFARFRNDATTAKAAQALVSSLEDGRLSSAGGRRLLGQLDAFIAADRDSARWPNTSDGVLLLASPDRFTRALSEGLPAHVAPTDHEKGLALTIAYANRLNTSSTNNVSGLIKYTTIGGVNTVLNLVGLGVDQSWLGVEGVRQTAGIAGDLQNGTSPDDRTFGLNAAARLASISREQGWGNCGELSARTATDLHRHGVRNVEIMEMIGDDPNTNRGTHAFVVIGRDPMSDPSDPSTWGPDAVIVESWDSPAVYPASQALARLPGRGAIRSHFRLPDP